MQSIKTSTTVTKKTAKKQTEYHLYIYKGEKKKTYVWVWEDHKKEFTLSDEQLIDIANKYFKVKKEELEAILLYRLGKNLYINPIHGSSLITVITKKK